MHIKEELDFFWYDLFFWENIYPELI